MTTTQRPRRPGMPNTARLPARGEGGGPQWHGGTPDNLAAGEKGNPDMGIAGALRRSRLLQATARVDAQSVLRTQAPSASGVGDGPPHERADESISRWRSNAKYSVLSGSNSSHVTSPAVKDSMYGQCTNGTSLSPHAILETIEGGMRKCRASATPRPLPAASHLLSSMARILFPKGETKATPYGEYRVFPPGNLIPAMKTSAETRRARLNILVEQHGSMADLCQALGYARNDAAKLSRIANGNVRHERGGKPYNMGDEMARAIEEKLELERGWMDTPPELELATSAGGQHLLNLFSKIPEGDRATAIRLLDAFAKPAEPDTTTNGTHG